MAPPLAESAKHYVLVQLGNMRGLDPSQFDFDFDWTWAALIFDPWGRLLSRYGGNPAAEGQPALSIWALADLLQRIAQEKSTASPLPLPSRNTEDFVLPGSRFARQSCFHCHNVYELKRESLQASRAWTREKFFVYPETTSLGFQVSVENRVESVQTKSPAEMAGLRRGDRIEAINGRRVFSEADLRNGLHHLPQAAGVALDLNRAGQRKTVVVALPKDWRVTDLSWRWSLKSVAPGPGVHGPDLSAPEKKMLGLQENQLAFRQGNFVPQVSQQAGVKIRDIILGVDDRFLTMNQRQFEAYIRLNYRVGDVVHYNILRGEERLKVPVKLNDP